MDDTIKTEAIKDVQDGVYYDYKVSLSGPNASRFKTNEIYRLGIQAQFKDGNWSDPVWIDDKPISNQYPWQEVNGRPTKSILIPKEVQNDLYSLYGVRKLRTCVVFPAVHERSILF